MPYPSRIKFRSPEAIEAAEKAMRGSTPLEIFGVRFFVTAILVDLVAGSAEVELTEALPLTYPTKGTKS